MRNSGIAEQRNKISKNVYESSTHAMPLCHDWSTFVSHKATPSCIPVSGPPPTSISAKSTFWQLAIILYCTCANSCPAPFVLKATSSVKTVRFDSFVILLIDVESWS